MHAHTFLMMILMALTPALARALPSYCDSRTVHRIQRPYTDQNGSFIYRYSIGDEIKPDDKVVIFIPGGPGQTSMDMSISIPSEFKLVRIDPRGVGCNDDAGLREADFNSEVLARDVLAVVRDLKLKSYMLQGISYGTVVATIAAALAPAEHTVAPAAVVLEGVIGRAFQPGEYLEGYLSAWARLKPQVSEQVLDLFRQEPLPFGISSEEWAAWISSNLIYGILPSGDDYALGEISILDTRHSLAEKNAFRNRVMRTIAPPSGSKTRLYREITCREIVPDVRDVKFDFDMVNGDLVATDKNFCGGLSLDRAFDSSRYQIPSPIYYFSGDLDPVTPLPQAQWHYDSQKGLKTWVTVSKGGHQALSANLSDCSADIWRAIADNDRARFDLALKTCAAPTRVQ